MKSDKLQIVRENLNLSSNEIKKELRKVYPDIKNDEVIELIIEVSKKDRETAQKKAAGLCHPARGGSGHGSQAAGLFEKRIRGRRRQDLRDRRSSGPDLPHEALRDPGL